MLYQCAVAVPSTPCPALPCHVTSPSSHPAPTQPKPVTHRTCTYALFLRRVPPHTPRRARPPIQLPKVPKETCKAQESALQHDR